jgi:hypothetical protein
MKNQEQLLQERAQIMNLIKECKQRLGGDYKFEDEYHELMNAKRQNTAELKNFNTYVLIK